MQGQYLLVSITCQGKLAIFSLYTTKEILSKRTCRGELSSVYSRQFFRDKGTCQRNLASVNEALSSSYTCSTLTFRLSIKQILYLWRCRCRSVREVLASMTGKATTTPQIKNLIGRASENKRAARAARTYEQVRAIFCKTTT